MCRRLEIKCSKAILVEGADAYYFCIWLLQHMGITDIQVFDFGGVQNADLHNFIANLKKLDGYDKIEKILVLRDAETSYTTAERSVKQTLSDHGLVSGGTPYVFGVGFPQTAYAIFPLTAGNGTLEDLCLETVATDSIMPCVTQFLSCVTSIQGDLTHPHKAKLHAFLAGKNGFSGLKLGEATRARAWNLDHQHLDDLKNAISSM